MSNRYEYVGSKGVAYTNDMKPLFNMNGNSIIGDNPYHTSAMLSNAIINATIFGHDHFMNNVSLPSWMNINSECMFYHDPEKDSWIAFIASKHSDGYHGYHVFV